MDSNRLSFFSHFLKSFAIGANGGAKDLWVEDVSRSVNAKFAFATLSPWSAAF
jgi:hypothetical protein